jgi:hypothetical protein
VNNEIVKVLRIVKRINLNATKILDNKDFITEINNTIEPDKFNRKAIPAIIDWKNDIIFLSDTANDEEIEKIPFFYQWQRGNIKELYSIPFSQYRKINIEKKSVKPFFVFSIGRCGSTLLVNLCKSLGKKTISEPDYLADIKNRICENQTKENISRILQWNTNLFSDLFGKTPLIKLRGSSINDIEIFVDTFPDSQYIFMLREPIAWAKSNMKAFNDSPKELAEYLKQGVESYDKFIQLGIKPNLIWYEDLVNDPSETLQSIFNDSSLINSKKEMILEVMSKDSQEGSSISQGQLAKIELKSEFLDSFKQHWINICPIEIIEKYKLQRLIIV